jgi:hypothetical protein
MEPATVSSWVQIPAAWLLLVGGAAHCQSALPQERRNWFEDPFFQVSSGLPACPVPLGPLLTRDEQRREAHGRIERGTSCWLAGKCRDSNAYRYDKGLAPQVEAALKSVPGIERSSVWVTLQRRWVFLEGCVASSDQIPQLERAAREVPEVEAVVPALSVGREAPRYRLRDEAGAK